MKRASVMRYLKTLGRPLESILERRALKRRRFYSQRLRISSLNLRQN